MNGLSIIEIDKIEFHNKFKFSKNIYFIEKVSMNFIIHLMIMHVLIKILTQLCDSFEIHILNFVCVTNKIS